MKKIAQVVLSTLLLLTVLDACQPLKEGYGIVNPGQYSRVYIAASYNGLKKYETTADKNIDIPIYANYSGVINLKSDLSVRFEADLSRVPLYNSANGTSYEALPEKCFLLEPKTVVIKAGATASDTPSVVRLLAAAFTDDCEYLLPVRIASLSDSSIVVNSDLETMYLSIICHAPDLQISVKPLTDYNVSPVENW